MAKKREKKPSNTPVPQSSDTSVTPAGEPQRGPLEPIIVPQYPFDETRKEEKSPLDFQRRMQIAWLWGCAPAAGSVDGMIAKRDQKLWMPDDFGMACYRGKVIEVLVDPGHFSKEDLKDLTFDQIFWLVDTQLRKSDHKETAEARDRSEQVLWPMYEHGFRRQEHWQKRVKEAVDSVTHWAEQLRTAGDLQPTPFPYMDADNRQPGDKDLLWMYVVLGMKLEEVFGPKHVFIPEHVIFELANQGHSVQRSIWGIVHRGASLTDWKTWWLSIESDLLKQGGGNQAASNGHISDTAPRGSAGVPYHDSDQAVVSVEARERIDGQRHRLRERSHVQLESLLHTKEAVQALREEVTTALRTYDLDEEEGAGPLSWLWDGRKPDAQKDLPGIALFILLADERWFGSEIVEAVIDDEIEIEYQSATFQVRADVDAYYRQQNPFDQDPFPKCVKHLVDQFGCYVVDGDAESGAEVKREALAVENRAVLETTPLPAETHPRYVVSVNDFRDSPSRRLLVKLLEDQGRTGIEVTTKAAEGKYGKDQPRTLRKILKARAKNNPKWSYWKEIADKIAKVDGQPHYFKLEIPCNEIDFGPPKE